MVVSVTRDACRFQCWDLRSARGREVYWCKWSQWHVGPFPLNFTPSAFIDPRSLAVDQFKVMGPSLQAFEILPLAWVGHESVIAY